MQGSEEIKPLIDVPVCEKDDALKRSRLLNRLNALTLHHYDHCDTYGTRLDRMGLGTLDSKTIEDVPMLPVRLFKLQ